jgi:hypothetical protein
MLKAPSPPLRRKTQQYLKRTGKRDGISVDLRAIKHCTLGKISDLLEGT